MASVRRKVAAVLSFFIGVSCCAVSLAAVRATDRWTSTEVIAAGQSLSSGQFGPEQVRATETLLTAVLDEAWEVSKAVGAATGPTTWPKLKVVLGSQMPYVSKGQIYVSYQFLAQMGSISMLIGHDALTARGTELPIVNPLLYKPLGVSQLLAGAPKAGSILTAGGFAGGVTFALMARCTAYLPDCAQLQNTSLMCGLFFVVGHEVGHYLAKHRDRFGGDYPQSEEIVADKHGAAVMKKFFRDRIDAGGLADKATETACAATPAAFFDLSQREATTEESLAMFEARKEAYLNKMTPGQRSDIEDLLEIKTDIMGTGKVTASWPSAPTLLLVDGVRIEAHELPSLLLSTGRHRLLGTTSTGLFYEEFTVFRGAVTKLTLKLFEFNPTPNISMVSALHLQKNWAQLLSATSNQFLRPTATSVAVKHWEALYNLKLGAWIDLNDGEGLTPTIIRRARLWRKLGLPVTSWDDELEAATQ